MSDVRDFGAKGDGQTDDTEAILHALKDGDGHLHFTPGTYLIHRTVEVDLGRAGPVGIDGSQGTAKIIMTGPGPAFSLVGTHGGSAQPSDFQADVWARERMPIISNLEIEGRHREAYGFRVEGVMQPTFAGVLLRELLHGIHLVKRCRNVIVSHCHIYNNRGVGVLMDHVNLHQAIITGSHISYCKRGGIKIFGSEIRNLQITGNDIEYNYDVEADASADVLIDCSEDRASVREGTITGNTIQAKYSPGGANVRMIGLNPQVNHKAGMFTISTNLIGSQETNVHLLACRGVVVSGNVIYSGHQRNLLVDGSRNIVVDGNGFDHNPDYQAKELCTGVRFANSHDCTFGGAIVHDCQTGQPTVAGVKPIERQGLVEILGCRRMTVSGCQILDGSPCGIYVENSSYIGITGCSVLETRRDPLTQAAIRFRGAGSANFVAASTLDTGLEKALDAAPESGVKVGENLIVERQTTSKT